MDGPKQECLGISMSDAERKVFGEGASTTDYAGFLINETL